MFYIGLLIMSSKWYASANYWFMQLLTIGAGIGALYFGNIYGIGLLSGIGGTFFCLYLIEKYGELPWKTVGYSWGLLGFGVLVSVLAKIALTNPQYFIVTLKVV